MSVIRTIDRSMDGAARGNEPAGAAATPHALVFDSGVGGLSVLREIALLLPGIRLTYAADNLAFPYGPKPEHELIERVTTVLGRLVAETAPNVVVVACNTASTHALDAARLVLPVPIVGVVPAIKPAAQASMTRTIGLLATTATVGSPYTRSLIAEFASGCRVISTAAPELVEAAERKIQGEPLDPAAIRAVLDRMLGAPGGDSVDTIVLGCTHFPLLKPELAEAAGREIAWMDSGAAIARRVATILKVAPAADALPAQPHRAIFTADTGAVERMRASLAGFGLTEIGFLLG